MKFYAALLAVLGLCACNPNDQHIKTVKERLDDGEIIEVTGKMHSGCKQSWSEIRTVTEEQKRVVVGKQQFIVAPGFYQCYEKGSSIPFEVNRKTDPKNGVIHVDRMFWARGDKLTKSKLTDRHFASTDEFNRYMANVKARSNYDGYVHILHITYQRGSALQEKAWIEEDLLESLGDGFEETLNDGDAVSRCNSPWTDLRLGDASFHQAILSGKLGSWFQFGQRNCLKQGDVIELKGGAAPNSPVIGRAKVKKIKRFRYIALDKKYFTLNNFEFAELETVIRSMWAARNDEWMTVTDIEVQP